MAKALRVLDALAQPEAPHRLGEIAERSGVSKASAHRILGTLISEGYAVPDGEGATASASVCRRWPRGCCRRTPSVSGGPSDAAAAPGPDGPSRGPQR
ncbi:helix-turn-helix domain-containing protein [Streptomyces sp. M10(2022)]